MTEVYNQLLLTLNNGMWYAVIIGSIVALSIEHEAIWKMYNLKPQSKDRPMDVLRPVLARLMYVAIGILIASSSYLVITLITRWIPINDITGLTDVALARAYLVSIALMVLSGYALSVSAGTRWLIMLSKIFATLSIVSLMALIVASYLV